MKRYPCFFVMLLAVFITGCDVAEKSKNDNLIITNVSVIDSRSGAVLENRDVIVFAGKIIEVRDSRGIATSGNGKEKIIDGTGKFLTPGLIDGHVHTGSMAGMSFAQGEEYGDLSKAYFVQQPKSYLYFGFTTVVDMNGSPDSFERFARGTLHPDLFHCGQALILEDGYPAVFVPRDVRRYVFPNQLYDNRKKDHTPGISADRNSVKKAVARVKDSGAICVKTFHEDGFSRSLWPVPSEDMLTEIRAESRQQNLKLLVHANSYESYQAMIKNGTDAMAHGLWNWDRFAAEDILPPELKYLLDKMINQGIAQFSTLQTMAGLTDLFDGNYLDRKALEMTLPPAYLDWLKSPKGSWYKESLIQDYPAGMSENDIRKRLENVLNRGQQTQKYFYERGGMVLFGSDTPSAPVATNIPGYNGYLELRRMAETGISLPDILKSATLNNARFFGLEKNLGTIEAGKTANMLLLSENPLQRIEAYNKIDLVILRGRVIDRENLAAR
ncbi:MAG: amidohydrolase family protein [Emcibacter sp.]|nr:amidohydrolase family protein [Emcibacter sp.]